MSASPAVFTRPGSLSRAMESRNGLMLKPFLAGGSHKRSSLCDAFSRNPVRNDRRHILSPKPVMEWQDCRAVMEVDVPCSVAYDLYSDREAFPRWMPMISSVKILKDKPDLSQWTLTYEFFGRDYTFSWLARNLQPIPNQKVHWRSLDGLPNRGAVRFFPSGTSSCTVEENGIQKPIMWSHVKFPMECHFHNRPSPQVITEKKLILNCNKSCLYDKNKIWELQVVVDLTKKKLVKM